MSEIQPWQIKRIYSIANSLHIVDNHAEEDELHMLVNGVVGKSSIKALTSNEADKVISELNHRMRFNLNPPKQKIHSTTPGGISAGQQKKVWALMYELQKQDTTTMDITAGQRLVKIINKELKVDAPIKEPFRWVKANQSETLIEALKGYIRSAKRKTATSGGEHYG